MTEIVDCIFDGFSERHGVVGRFEVRWRIPFTELVPTYGMSGEIFYMTRPTLETEIEIIEYRSREERDAIHRRLMAMMDAAASMEHPE
jgi:hypothetical protein